MSPHEQRTNVRLIVHRELKPRKGIDYSRVHLSRLMAAGKFPQKIKLSGGRIAWLESEIDNWILEKARERSSNA